MRKIECSVLQVTVQKMVNTFLLYELVNVVVFVWGDNHTHVAMLSINMTLMISTLTPIPLTLVKAIKIISANLSIFCEKCHITTIKSYGVFSTISLTEDNTIEARLFYAFLQNSSVFLFTFFQFGFKSIIIVSNQA